MVLLISRRSRRFLLLSLLLLVAVIRFVPDAGELYATWVYPGLSLALSFLASLLPYSLEEWIVILSLLLVLLYPLVALCFGRRLKRILLGEGEWLAWIVAWFYLGWGCNYFRHDFYRRLMLQPATFEKADFTAFLQEYTDSLNAAFTKVEHIDAAATLKEIQDIYRSVPSGYGLTRPQTFQQPKPVLFNDLYNGVGVLGYMGPFMCESQLNMDLLPVEYPFVLAHETAHLLGVSSEAEANFWAYCVCQHSDVPEIRYSGLFSLLPYVWRNALTVLTPEEVKRWKNSVNPEIFEALNVQRQYWMAKENPVVNRVQETLYNWFLKGNRIESGTKNYNEVVGMLMAVRENHEEPLRRQGRRLSVKQ
ncbi:MAG: DUF3810 domain-containing protein [Bacteroidaceae bacterium]|nr:DUF3810 domain-containing protein [Bacteroidaceae bacterium]